MTNLKIGIGYDVHRFTDDRPLILGGVNIPYNKGLDGHSDADVLIHSIMDSILGAAGLPDIGNLFPNDDKKYKDISSLCLLKETYNIIKKKLYSIVNIDSVIIAQKPKIAPYIADMKKNIVSKLIISETQINVKGTTTEYLGFTGREEGIVSISVCMLEKN